MPLSPQPSSHILAMLVRLHMSQNPMTVDLDDSAISALRTMRKMNIRHLPITEQGRLCGMVTERDLMRVLPSFVLDAPEQKDSPVPIQKALTRKLISVTPNDSMDSAARIFLEHKISGLPVLDAGQLVGILTSDDVLHAFLVVFEHLDATQLVMLHGAQRGNARDFDPASCCAQLGIELHSLVRHDARRGAELFVLAVRAPKSKLDQFQQLAVDAGWMRVAASGPTGDETDAQAA